MDIRQQITDEIVLAMEKGVAPWRRGWTSGELAFNASSGQAYKGINQVILGMQATSDPRWMTYKQAEGNGVQIRKGEHGVRVVKMIEMERNRAERESRAGDGGGEVLAVEGRKALVMKAYTVFNANQIEGLAPLRQRETAIEPAEVVEAVVWGLQDTGLKLNFGGNQPAYYPRTDEIRIPVAADFHSLEDFHGTLLHEAAHASGHPKRLARLHMDSRFGSPEYAREELRAELASAMMSGLVGLPPGQSMIDSHAAYLAHWLTVLRSDKGEIFKAAADAQKICDYLSERALQVSLTHHANERRKDAEEPANLTDSTAPVGVPRRGSAA